MKKKALNYIFFTLAFFSLFFSQKTFAITNNVCEDLVPATPPSDCYVNASHSSVTANGGYGYYKGIYPDTSNPLTVVLTPTTFSAFAVQDGISPNNNYWFIGRNISGIDYWYQIYNNGTGNVSFNPLASELSSTTRIHQIITPSNNSTTILSTVSFQFEYFATGADGYDVAGYELQDVTANQFLIPKETAIIASGYSTFSTTTSLASNHLHLWRAYLKNSSNNLKIYSTWNAFNVVGASASSTEITVGETATSTGFLAFLNVPELLKTRKPFAYFFQLTNTMQNLDSLATTSVPSGTFDWKWASGTPAETTIAVDLFSTTTVRSLLNPTTTNILRGLMVAVTYFSVMWAMYHEAKRWKHLMT